MSNQAREMALILKQLPMWAVNRMSIGVVNTGPVIEHTMMDTYLIYGEYSADNQVNLKREYDLRSALMYVEKGLI